MTRQSLHHLVKKVPAKASLSLTRTAGQARLDLLNVFSDPLNMVTELELLMKCVLGGFDENLNKQIFVLN